MTPRAARLTPHALNDPPTPVDSRPGATSARTRIPVQLTSVARRVFLAQLTQHLPAVITVLTAGASAIMVDGEHGSRALAAAELLVGTVVVAMIVREAWHAFGRHAGHGAATPPADTSWIEGPGLAAAALGYVEVWHRTHAHGQFKLVSPQMLGATATLFLALGGRRLIAERFRDRRPHLMVTAKGASYRGSRWTRWVAEWADVVSVEHGDDVVSLRMRDGSVHALRADDHLGGAGMIAAARDAFARHAPASLASVAPPGAPAVAHAVTRS